MRNWGSTQSLFSSASFAERDSLFETALKRRTILWLFSTSLSFYLLRSKNSVDSLLHWTKKRPKKQLSSLQSNCRVWKLENGQSFDRLPKIGLSWTFFFIKCLINSSTMILKIERKLVVMGQTMFDVWCSIDRSYEYGCPVQLPIDEHVWDCSMFEKMMFESVRWVIW